MTRILHRRGTAAQWSAADPVLSAGELGFETDTGRHKIGDGARAWSALRYFLPEDALTIWAEAREQRLARVTPVRVPRRVSRPLTTTASGFEDWYGEGTVGHVPEAKAGPGSVRVVSPTSAAVANGLRSFPAVDMSAHHLKVWVRVDRWGDLGGSQIRLHTSETVYFFAHLGAGLARTARVDGEWVELVLPRSAFTARTEDGVPSWSSIRSLAFTLWSPEGTTVELLACQPVLVPDAPAGVVSLTFDDGWESQYRAARIMEEFGWVGTAYLIHHKLDSPGFLTTAQVEDLHERGWDIGGHDDIPLRTLDDGQLVARLSANAQWLREHNFRGRHHYAYPNGSVDDRVVEVVRRYFATARTINPINHSLSWISEHRLTGVSVFSDQDDAEVEALVAAAVNDGEWANIVFHKIGDEGDDISWTEARFRTFLGHVAASGAVVQPVGGVL